MSFYLVSPSTSDKLFRGYDNDKIGKPKILLGVINSAAKIKLRKTIVFTTTCAKIKIAKIKTVKIKTARNLGMILLENRDGMECVHQIAHASYIPPSCIRLLAQWLRASNIFR